MTRSSSVLRPRSLALLAAACCTICFGRSARAQTLDGYVELYGGRQNTSISSLGGPAEEQETAFHWESLWIDYRTLLWPNLELELGGAFDWQTTQLQIDAFSLNTKLVDLRPFAALRLRTGLHRIEFDWNHVDTRGSTDGLSTRLLRDYYSLLLGWYPQPRSLLELRVWHAYNRDDQFQFLDQRIDEISLLGLYTPRPWITFDYRLLDTEVDDDLVGAQYGSTSHNGKVTFSKWFIDRRLLIASSYNINYDELRTDIPGTGVIESFVPPIAGLAAITDFPQQVTLEPNPALIDRNLTAGAGINLGLPPPAGDDRPRNFGVDFEVERSVNTLRVWMDREIRLETASAFVWEIWSSTDNVRWTAEQVVSRAEFGPFDNRFELRFGTITARYLKVVVQPLSAGDPFASDYPVLLVTELEPLLRRQVSGYEVKETQTRQRFTADMRYRVLERPNLDLLLNYLWVDPGNESTRDNLLVGASLFHPFARYWSVTALGTAETGREQRGRRRAETLNATLSATPLPTLRASLGGTARREELAGERVDSGGLTFSTTANLYKGVDLTFGYGRSRQERSTGEKAYSTNLNLLLALAPRRDLTVSLLYQDTVDKTSGGTFVDRKTGRSAAEVSLVYTPLPSIYLYAAYRREWYIDRDDRSLRNVSISWTPFPGSRTQLLFRFEEQYDSIFDTVTRNWGAGGRWNVASGTWIEVFYDVFRVDSEVQEISRNLLSATLHFGF